MSWKDSEMWTLKWPAYILEQELLRNATTFYRFLLRWWPFIGQNDVSVSGEEWKSVKGQFGKEIWGVFGSGGGTCKQRKLKIREGEGDSLIHDDAKYVLTSIPNSPLFYFHWNHFTGIVPNTLTVPNHEANLKRSPLCLVFHFFPTYRHP